MYLLFQGEVGIYVADENHCVATLKDSKVFGERALETDDKRGATIIAHTNALCLILLKKDYKEIIYVRAWYVFIVNYSILNWFKNLRDNNFSRVYHFSRIGHI